MDKSNNFYFYISGLISLFLFTFFLSIFIISIVSSKKNKIFAVKKDNYISISIDMIDMHTASAKKSKDVPVLKKEIVQEPVKEKPIVKEKEIKSEKKEISVDELFSDVWTKNIKNVKEKKQTVDKRVLHSIKKKIDKSNANEVKSISQDIQKIDTTNSGDKNSKSSRATEVNEYLAKIQALVYKYFEPPENSQGNSVVAVIELSSIGKVLDFRILTYSNNEALNQECNKIKDRLIGILFPENPDNISGVYKIKLISKE